MNIKRKIFEDIVPLVWPLLKKQNNNNKRTRSIRLGHASIVDQSVNLSIPD